MKTITLNEEQIELIKHALMCGYQVSSQVTEQSIDEIIDLLESEEPTNQTPNEH